MQDDTNSTVSKGWDYLTCPPLGVGCGMVYKTGIMLVMETTWILVVAFLLPWLLHVSSADLLPDRASGKRSPEDKKKEKKG